MVIALDGGRKVTLMVFGWVWHTNMYNKSSHQVEMDAGVSACKVRSSSL